MGLFDRFRKRVQEVAEEADDQALSVEASSEEAQSLLDKPQPPVEEEWEDVDAVVETVQPVVEEEDEWLSLIHI